MPLAPKAFSLVEVTVAIGLMSFCLVALLGLLPVGLKQERKSADQLLALQALSAVVVDFQKAPLEALQTSTYGMEIPIVGGGTKEGTLVLDQNLAKTVSTDAKQFDITYRVEAPVSKFSNYRFLVRVLRTAQPSASLDQFWGDYVESVAMKSAM